MGRERREVLYLLGILVPGERRESLPLILTGPESSAAWFEALEALLLTAFGYLVRLLHDHLGDPETVARAARTA